MVFFRYNFSIIMSAERSLNATLIRSSLRFIRGLPACLSEDAVSTFSDPWPLENFLAFCHQFWTEISVLVRILSYLMLSRREIPAALSVLCIVCAKYSMHRFLTRVPFPKHQTLAMSVNHASMRLTDFREVTSSNMAFMCS